jgi:hypothetical protein
LASVAGPCDNQQVSRQLSLVVALVAALGCSKSAKVEAQADADGVRGSAEVGDETAGAAPSESWGAGEGPPPAEAGRAVQPSVEGDARALATLPGFRMFRDGSSRVFVEVLGRVPVTEEKAERRVVIHLRGVQVPEKVNKMDLPTTHFSTPVGRIHLLQVGDDADLVIDLRAAATSRVNVNQTETGTVVSVDFPRFGAAQAAPSPTPPSAETSMSDDAPY